MLPSFLSREFLLHIPCWFIYLFIYYHGNFSYTSRAAFIFISGVSLTHPVLALILLGDFLRHIPCWLPFDKRSFVLFLCSEFLLHIPCCLHFCAGSLSDTSPCLPSFLRGEFLLHIPSCLHFYMGNLSYTSHAGFLYAGSFSYTSRADFFYVRSFFYTANAGFFSFLFYVRSFSSAVYSEDNPLKKVLGGSWLRRTVWKSHTQTREGSPRPEDSRTKPEKNWVKSGHRNERGRKEMGLSSKQALAEKAKEWMDPSSANYPKDNHAKK